MHRLTRLRARIDWIDSQIAALLNERMQAVDQIGKIKKTIQQDIVDHSRESSILQNLESAVRHPILKANISNIYKEILQESKTAQKFFDHPQQPFGRIGVIGTGLIGGSICKGIKTKDSSIEIGTLAHSPANGAHAAGDSELAHAGGWVDHVYSNIEDLVQNSDLIILASPISTIIPYAQQIKHHAKGAKKKLVVMDVASIKGEIADNFEKLSGKDVVFVGTHPMAGKETSGFANALPTLFVNKSWVVVPNHKAEDAIANIQELILFLGATPVQLDAKIHDQQAALVSHLPSILSKYYFEFVNSIDPDSLQISGPGFQSFTRLAHDNEEMRAEIDKYNHPCIKNYLDQWVAYLKK